MSIEKTPRCRTGENRSYRCVAMLTIVAMLGFAGLALAGTGNHQGTKLVPSSRDVMAKKAGTLATAEAPPRQVGVKHGRGGPLAPPSNDECSGAIVIPSGTLPVVTTPEDITEATPVTDGIGNGGEDFCTSLEHTIWYSFTPTVSAQYTFATCPGLAPGNDLLDTVIAVFDACGGTDLACNDTGACHGPTDDTSIAAAVLTAGNTYYVVVGHWGGSAAGSNDPIGPGNDMIQVQVDLSPAPSNDTCASPTPLALDRITQGTTAAATNDYRSIPNACFAGFGQIPSTSNGLDVVFSFTPPDNDLYSFRYVQDDSAAALRGQSPVLYLADDCPPPDPSGGAPPHCLAAANRMNDQSPAQAPANGNRSEEINCIPLTGGTPYYLFFDDRFTANAGGPLAVEVTRCKNEVEPNDTIAQATPFAPNSGCFMEGTAAPSGAGHCSNNPTHACSNDAKCWTCSGNTARFCYDISARPVGAPDGSGQCLASEGTCGFDPAQGTCVFPEPGKDVDFYDLGVPPAGSKIFVGVDTAAAGNGDFELRITNANDTLGYDDDDGTSWTGAQGAVVAGAVADGNEIYARVDSVQLIAGSEPYSLFARIETGVAQNEDLPDDHSIDGLIVFDPATHVTGGGFVKGVMSTTDDMDCFKFIAHEGDNILFFSDNNPGRTPGLITNVFPVLGTLERLTPSNAGFFGQILRNNVTASPGTLVGLTPSVTSEWSHYRARYTGAYLACFTPTSDSVNGRVAPPAGAYPLPYQGSISINCGPVPGPTPADVSITNTGPVGPVRTGDFLTYTVTITNNDATGVAQDVRLVDNLPAETVYLGATVDDGFGGRNFACANLPTPGTNDNPLDCTVVSLAPGATATYTIQVQVNNCIGAGVTVTNSASISSFTADNNPSNDSATWAFLTSEDGTCTDLICDISGCVSNACTIDDHCVAGVCTSTPLDCDDHTVCTLDSCDPTWVDSPTDHSACINDSSQYGDLCFDGNDCTLDTCDPELFCQFSPLPAGTSCNDFLNCTNGDTCDGHGTCVGLNVCDDGQPCTDDFADEANNCFCTNDVSFQGTLCDDGNACTTGTTCDGNGGTAASCVNPTGVIDCNDNNPCTDDSCDPALGCVHTDNTATCSDGNACTTGDTCGGGACNPGTPLDCNDNNPCTDDSCIPATGCVHVNNAASCSDGNACTVGDTCAGGVCSPGAPVVCNDANACTNDSCNPATGCSYTPNTAACDDGNACTTNDTCGGGTCHGGSALVCNDNNVCTTDTCNPSSGCVFTNNTVACDDGNGCTQTDTCSGGACIGANPVVCAASDSCHTVGVCAPATGVCSNPVKADGSACDDGSACTVNDTCAAGVCLAGTALDCNDNNVCTFDGCDPASGCVHADADMDTASFSANRVDGRDLVILADSWNACPGDAAYNPIANLDQAACVDMDDFHLFMTTFGRSCQ